MQRAVVRHRRGALPLTLLRHVSTAMDTTSTTTTVTPPASSNFYAAMSPEKQLEFNAGREQGGQRSVQMRMWNFIAGMGDALSIVREVERQFGTLSEFKFEKVRL